MGVTLALAPDLTSVTLKNASAARYWIQPDLAPVWHGGSPWVASGDWPNTGVALEPGAIVELRIGPVGGRPARVGVQVWASDTPDTMRDEPWFAWAELP